MIYDCIIVGGGASGLFCAASFSDFVTGLNGKPLNGLILEKTQSAGTKLLMSGSGQCNITHAGSIKDFIVCYGKNGSKVRSCLYKYNNLSLVDFLENSGIPTVTREDGKVFPRSMDAHDILDLLVSKAKQNGFRIRNNESVIGIGRACASGGCVGDACTSGGGDSADDNCSDCNVREDNDCSGRKDHAMSCDGDCGGDCEVCGRKNHAMSCDVDYEVDGRKSHAKCKEIYNAPGESSSRKTDANDETTVWQIKTENGLYLARTVVFAAGGCSYPKTGSDGSIFPVLRKDLGLDIVPLKPALASIRVTEYPYSGLSGISFENAQVTIIKKSATPILSSADDFFETPEISKNDISYVIKNNPHTGCSSASETGPAIKSSKGTGKSSSTAKKSNGPVRSAGPVLLTHKDFSGPGVLNISKFADSGDILKINYLYPLNQEQVLEALKAAFKGSKAEPANIICDRFELPKRFCQALVKRCGSSLKALAAALAGEEFTIASSSGFNTAMATAGGVHLPQINLNTMESKQHSGLFFIGEMLDIDGITGGYNLQFAYSSARAAAAEIALQLGRESSRN